MVKKVSVIHVMVVMLLLTNLGVTQEVVKVTQDEECMEERKLSKEGLEFLKEKEGVMLEIYRDAGKLAGGVGHQLTTEELKVWKRGQFVPECQVEEWLRMDVTRFEKVVNNWVVPEITQIQFDSLVSFAFNIGESAFKRSTFLKRLNKGDIDGAMKEMARWKWSQGKINSNLVARRADEERMFREGIVA